MRRTPNRGEGIVTYFALVNKSGKSTLISVGIKIREIESDQKLQDALLTLHHFFCICFDQTPVTKIICNQTGLVYAVQSRSVSVSR